MERNSLKMHISIHDKAHDLANIQIRDHKLHRDINGLRDRLIGSMQPIECRNCATYKQQLTNLRRKTELQLADRRHVFNNKYNNTRERISVQNYESQCTEQIFANTRSQYGSPLLEVNDSTRRLYYEVQGKFEDQKSALSKIEQKALRLKAREKRERQVLKYLKREHESLVSNRSSNGGPISPLNLMSKVSNESMQGDELSQSQQRFFPSCVASIGNRKSLQRERMKSDQGVLNGFHEEQSVVNLSVESINKAQSRILQSQIQQYREAEEITVQDKLQRLRIVEEEYKQCEQYCHSIQLQRNKLSQKLSQMQTAFQNIKILYESSEGDKLQIAQRYLVAQQSNQQLILQHHQGRTMLTELTKAVRQKEQQIANLLDNNEYLSQKLSEIIADQDEKQAQVMDIITDLKQQIKNIQSEKNETLKNHEQTERQIVELEELVEQGSSKNIMLIERNAILCQEISRMKIYIEQCQQQKSNLNEEFERHEMGLRKLTNEIGCLQLQLREKEREGKEIINMMKVEIEQAKRENGQSEIKWLEEKADLKKYIEESQERIQKLLKGNQQLDEELLQVKTLLKSQEQLLQKNMKQIQDKNLKIKMEDEKLKAINADYNTLKIQNALMAEMLQEMKNANEQLSEANSKVVQQLHEKQNMLNETSLKLIDLTSQSVKSTSDNEVLAKESQALKQLVEKLSREFAKAKQLIIEQSIEGHSLCEAQNKSEMGLAQLIQIQIEEKLQLAHQKAKSSQLQAKLEETINQFNQAFKDTIEIHKEQMKRQEQAYESLLHKFDTLQVENAESRGQLEDTFQNIKQQQTKISELEVNNQELRSQINRVEKELAEQKQCSKSLNQISQTKITEMRDSLKNKEEKIAQLALENEQNKEIIKTERAEVQLLQQQNHDIKLQITLIASSNQQLLSLINEQKNDIKNACQEFDRLKEESKAKDFERAELMSKIQSKDQNISKITDERNKEEIVLRQNIVKLNEEVSQYKEIIQRLTKQNSQLNQQINELKTKKQQLLCQLEEENSKLEKATNEMTTFALGYRAKLIEIEQHLNRQSRTKQFQIRKIQQENENIAIAFDGKIKECKSQSQHQITVLKRSFEKQLQIVRAQLLSKTNEVKSLGQQLLQLESKLQQLRQQSFQHKKQSSRSIKTIQQQCEKLQHSTKEIKQLHMQQISKIEQKLKENDLDELDNSLDRVADEAKYLQPYEIVVRKSTSQSEVTSEQSSQSPEGSKKISSITPRMLRIENLVCETKLVPLELISMNRMKMYSSSTIRSPQNTRPTDNCHIIDNELNVTAEKAMTQNQILHHTFDFDQDLECMNEIYRQVNNQNYKSEEFKGTLQDSEDSFKSKLANLIGKYVEVDTESPVFNSTQRFCETLYAYPIHSELYQNVDYFLQELKVIKQGFDERESVLQKFIQLNQNLMGKNENSESLADSSRMKTTSDDTELKQLFPIALRDDAGVHGDELLKESSPSHSKSKSNMLLIDGLSEAASDEEQQDRMQELRTEWNKEDSNNKNSKLTKSQSAQYKSDKMIASQESYMEKHLARDQRKKKFMTKLKTKKK